MKQNPELTNSRPEFKKFPKKLNKHYENLAAPHVNSFNEMLDYGLQKSVKHLLPVYLETPTGERIKIEVLNIRIARPQVPSTVVDVKTREIYPAEARLCHATYAGKCTVRLGWTVDELVKAPIDIDVGDVPVMLRSKACNLHNLTPQQMVERGEHDTDWGGIFIIRGNEKIIRMLMMTRRNYPIALKRSTWKGRGKNFSEYGIMLRSVREDEVSGNNVMHYLKNGTVKLMFAHNKVMSYIPICLLLKCLIDCTDEELFQCLTQGCEDDQYYVSCVKEMIRENHNEGLHTHLACKRFVGDLFRTQIRVLAPWADGIAAMDFILEQLICMHLSTNQEKFDLLVFMTQKLFKCVQGKHKLESVDAPMLQDVLTPGMLYQKILVDRVDSWLQIGKVYLDKKLKSPGVVLTPAVMSSCFRGAGISRGLETFLATGNANSRSGLGLMQNSGLVVMAECINRMRYMSHFRAVHRGSFFTTMRTTEARQLLPDAWGFICPVHTPDGTPCGLLNHLSVECQISSRCEEAALEKLPKMLVDIGLVPLHSCLSENEGKTMVVCLEGKILGYIQLSSAEKIVNCLRAWKIEGKLPQQLEIGYIPYEDLGQFPGIFLFIGPGRMMRGVTNLALGKTELIGTLEQVYMEIAVDAKEAYEGLTTHMELSKTAFLSNLANLIPMPDYNQSPRNMYQCQMGKQTMGTPCLNWTKQAATKLYRLQTPATPLFRPVHYDNLRFDDFAMGTNAIVAVISYTGYDMEDAMIINKAAHERGFAHGCIYKSKFVELKGTNYFARNPNDQEVAKTLDNDGLPQAGTRLTCDTPFYSYYDNECFKYFVIRYKENEEVIVDSVRYCGEYKTQATPQRTVCITVRVPRQPTIGDKFASRAGQKGIFSQQYPAEDLPFSETGLIPDIVFNPHGFPSRMTIAMMIETLAGKSAALHGLVHDATPFRFTEKETAIDYFGKLLETAGYNYYGTERLYSGVNGVEMTADIFFGVVHYQRLRHMVSDKWQVRSTGTVDPITSQPIKGRRRGGGVRFGEMERDALISHGAAYLLQDRLFYNSDKKNALTCAKCGTILAPVREFENDAKAGRKTQLEPFTCRLCGEKSKVGLFEIPASYRYLVAELGALNINSRVMVDDI